MVTGVAPDPTPTISYESSRSPGATDMPERSSNSLTIPLSAPMRPISRRSLLQSLLAHRLLVRPAHAQSRVLTKPKTLAAGAVTHDWSSFLGPTHNAVSTETKLSRAMPPPLVWEFPKGTSYASPAVAGGRALFIYPRRDHQGGGCLGGEEGARPWPGSVAARLRGRRR